MIRKPVQRRQRRRVEQILDVNVKAAAEIGARCVALAGKMRQGPCGDDPSLAAKRVPRAPRALLDEQVFAALRPLHADPARRLGCGIRAIAINRAFVATDMPRPFQAITRRKG